MLFHTTHLLYIRDTGNLWRERVTLPKTLVLMNFGDIIVLRVSHMKQLPPPSLFNYY